MKRFLLTLLAVATVATMGAQTVCRAAHEKVAASAPQADGLEWMRHCSDDVTSVGGVGTGGGTTIGVATRFSKEFLADYAGKEISLVAICLYSPLQDVEITVKKGDNIATANEVATENAASLGAGWNYVQLSEPVAIDGTEAISIAYEALDTGDMPYGFDGDRLSSADTGMSYLKMGYGSYEDISGNASYRVFGNAMIMALVGGDMAELENRMVMDDIRNVDAYVLENSNIEARCYMTNNSFNEISSATLTYAVNGTEKNEEIAFAEPVAPHTQASCTVNIPAAAEDMTITFKISKINGQDNALVNVMKKELTVYGEDDVVDRTILIEKFTGAGCVACPSAETNIEQVTEGLKDRIVRVNYYTYSQDDPLWDNNCQQIAKFFGMSYAPACMLDRSIQEERIDWEQYDGIIWHPSYMTTEMLQKEIDKPALVTLDVEGIYDESTKNMTVTVKGKGNINLAGKRLTILLTQDGYVGYQSGAGTTEDNENYVHNYFPIVYFTSYNGNTLRPASDGTYEMSLRKRIPDTYATTDVKVDLSKCKVVAFIGDWDEKKTSPILNAASADVQIGKSVDSQSAEAAVKAYYAGDGKIAFTAPCEDVEVYDMAGVRLENRNLSSGVYIVRFTCGATAHVQKVAID